ncbi:unnamed protein product [Effrenium voratum]|nr:unnamed protein product [Effrenium voratum]
MLDIQRESLSAQLEPNEVQRDLEQLRPDQEGPGALGVCPGGRSRRRGACPKIMTGPSLTRSFHSFQLPEVPGADFSLSFSGLAAEQRDEGWRLSLTARGPVLQLAIALSLCYEIQGKRRPLAGRLVQGTTRSKRTSRRGEPRCGAGDGIAGRVAFATAPGTCRE